MEGNKRVVVTGLGAVTPLGNTVDETWDAMKAGKNGIAPITLFDTEKFKVHLGAEVKDFDPVRYMSVNESLRTDRYAQFALAAADQAVADSGIRGNVDPNRFAVYFGTGIGGIRTFETEHSKLLDRGPRRVSPLLIPMMISNMAAGLIAIRYGCHGSALPAVTACASGSNAIGEAVRMIRHGYADAVIAGGAEAAVCASAVAGFGNMGALSTSDDPDEASLPFDARRKGFVIGEGAACLILEEYERAKARGAHIYGEICGYGSTCDGYHMTAVQPEAEQSSRAIVMAMEEAGYKEGETVYVNAHGTGTPMNDSVETIAIKKAFGDSLDHVLVSSTKSMTGHMLGAAGAIEALACLLSLRDGLVPPTINLREKDAACDIPVVAGAAVKQDMSLALSNSFGFGGHNVCLAFRKV
ncbi:MAG: beta-ketoacyl-ACP synthase II [Lachnospiraceae bacterium]|jgi:3-oxoacyl-[acyl-carrier-protein] synthase II